MTSLALANPPTLMSLPIELRCKIYVQVFDNEGKIHALNRRPDHRPKRHQKRRQGKMTVPPLLLACKQIHAEGTDIFWQKRLLWLNKATYKYLSDKFLASSMTLSLLVPKLSQTVAANIRHIRGQDTTQWAKMNKGRARFLLRQLPNLKTFRFHGKCHAWPFWSGSEYDEGIMKSALEYCGGDFGPVNDTQDIIKSFPLNPNTCKIEFQVVIVWTAMVLDDYDVYEIHINLNTGKHKIVPGRADDFGEFELGHWVEEDEVWEELRAVQ
ncbi:Uu.00g134900.m01.CDS01 [Anthostomella pinea]|uniref:Uu.00g134900.m01.CDS01 n=1 Tax=Anthostomella pinea TaxID=933095 RepID=A0AAI8YKZ6_9PEZI|nr:Uu.00g134900.m01.CDS01 [Anthostomella pinea]